LIRKHEYLEYKVWLEKQGQRIFEPAGQIPAKVLNALKKETGEAPWHDEHKWVRFMIQKGWLQAFLEGTAIKLVVYPQTEKRIRLVPLLGKEQHLTPGEVRQPA